MIKHREYMSRKRKTPNTWFNLVSIDPRVIRDLREFWSMDNSSRCKCGARYIENENINLLVCGDSNRHKEWEKDNT